MPVIGFLNGGTAAKWKHLLDAYHAGLNEGGYVEGRNVALETVGRMVNGIDCQRSQLIS